MAGKVKIFVAQPIFLLEKQNYLSHDQILAAKKLANDQFLVEKAKFWSHGENSQKQAKIKKTHGKGINQFLCTFT